MGTSKMRDRLSRVTDAPVQSARRGGLAGLLRGGAADQRGHDRDGGPMSGLRGQIGQQSRHQDGPGLQQAAWGAAGRAGTAMAGAAGLAARAGQSAGSALAGRVSDVSGRLTEHPDDASWPGRQGARMGGRGLGRQWDDAGQFSREQRAGRSWERPRGRGAWDEPARQQRWSQRDDSGHGWDDARRNGNGMTARMGRADEGEQGIGAALGLRGPARGELRMGDDRPGRGWEQPGGQLGLQAREQRGRGRRRGQRGTDQLGGWDDQAGRRPGQRWERPDLMSREELIGGHSLPRRHSKRIERAHDSADESARRAFEASERAMRHSHSRRALKDERKAVAQADRAQRMLEQHVARAERRMASTQRRRRRGLGLVMLAGAGAGITIAARRMLSQPGGGQQAPGSLDQTGASTTRATTTTRYPADDRMPDSLRDDVTAGHRAGTDTDTMSDSTSRRF
ncbi:hypothetical protein [Pseudofrankia sp. DC12]|uniref:hypothetical protein n=1 Tax=Pseudofrankia sp. DC12 TaxID=683315 RepID=UPI0005F838D6|nr:hypothetical protein [Pseudofrankia sp. DC12]